MQETKSHQEGLLLHIFNGNLKVKTEKDGDFHYIEHISDLCEITGMKREAIEDLEEKRERKVRFKE